MPNDIYSLSFINDQVDFVRKRTGELLITETN